MTTTTLDTFQTALLDLLPRLRRLARILAWEPADADDLTQLTLGVDRDSDIVAHVFSERDPAVMAFIAQAIRSVKQAGRKIGICGQAPSDYPEFAQFLVQQGIDSISLNPDSVLKTTLAIAEMEKTLGR